MDWKCLVVLEFMCLCSMATGGYIPPGVRYRCPKEYALLQPCSCDIESDDGITVSCNNTNLASMSVALNNLAAFKIPVVKLTIYKCHFARLYGSLLYNSTAQILHIEDTPIETIEEYTFLGINETLKELHIINSSLKEFPTKAFKILGNLVTLNMDLNRLPNFPKDAFSGSDMAGTLETLRVSNGDLETPLVESLQPLRKLKILDLHGNSIRTLKRNQFRGLRDVESLDLSFNNITKIDGSNLGDLTKLKWLNISHNSLTDITRGAFARNTVLRVLNMSFNKIKKLDTNSFKGMRFLRRLYLSDNIISDVGRGSFGSLAQIGTIDLSRNLIDKIDYQMFNNLRFIEQIDVSENRVTEIQKLAFKDLFLTSINLSRNAISKVEAEAFVNCANITFLDLSHNKIKNLTKRAFDEATYATELHLAYNYFTELNQVPLQNMSGLKILNVSHNDIWRIPRHTFPKLYELHTIDLSHNNLSEIFNAVFQTLFSLRTLDLSYNSLETIKPSAFGALPTLLELNLSYNKLNNIARSALTRLASCRMLILKGNKLDKLFQLPISVSHMDLSYNEFEELPPKLWPSMNSLLSIDLSHNKLGDNLVYGSFQNLLTLQRLNLNYNGMSRPPWEALSELSSLQYLYMEGNNLAKLDRAAFSRLPVVFELNLAYNNLKNVSSRAFDGLLQLIVLNMTHNNLTHIPNGAFQGLVSLRSLDLSHNRIVKLDNKTHSLFEDLLSLEHLNLSSNKISSITRKTFPSDPYVPYRLKEVDLSYNSMPVITFDLTFGTAKLEKLNLSHNSIADIRRGVIGNLTRLRSIDLSYNQLTELPMKSDAFPGNLSELYISNNQLRDLPWESLMNVSRLRVLDVADNEFTAFKQQLTTLVKRGTSVYFHGNPLTCNCLLRPLHRFFQSQLDLKPFYRSIKCGSPPFLEGTALFEVPDDRLNCPSNVNTTLLMEKQPDDYDITPDFKFREFKIKRGQIHLQWRVSKPSADIADPYVIISNVQRPSEVSYRETLSYSTRTLDLEVKGSLADQLLRNDTEHRLCLLATDSKSSVRGFYESQCRDVSRTLLSSSGRVVGNYAILCFVIYLLCVF